MNDRVLVGAVLLTLVAHHRAEPEGPAASGTMDPSRASEMNAAGGRRVNVELASQTTSRAQQTVPGTPLPTRRTSGASVRKPSEQNQHSTFRTAFSATDADVTALPPGIPIRTLDQVKLPESSGKAVTETAQAAHDEGADFVRHLAGVWAAPEDRTERVSDLDVSVFGPHAFDVRNVSITIHASGDAALRVSSAVIDSKGRKQVPSVIDAKLRIGVPEATSVPIRPAVTVVSAEETYLDGTDDRWPIDGARASLSITDPKSSEMNFRFDTKDGRGSFGVTLTRGHRK